MKINKTIQGKKEIKMDPRMSRIILQNLLSNSMKYTNPKGKIDLNLDVNNDSLTIKIIDNGLGIPLKSQSKIFTKFYRADNVKEIDAKGTGLGLYLVKSLVEKSGGNIEFSSEENKGTTFHITLPLKK